MHRTIVVYNTTIRYPFGKLCVRHVPMSYIEVPNKCCAGINKAIYTYDAYRIHCTCCLVGLPHVTFDCLLSSVIFHKAIRTPGPILLIISCAMNPLEPYSGNFSCRFKQCYSYESTINSRL